MRSKNKDWLQRDWHGDLPREIKRVIMVLSDVFILVIALWAAFALRLSAWWPENFLAHAWGLFALMPVLGVAIFHKLGIYSIVIRFVSLRFLLWAASGIAILVLAQYVFVFLSEIELFPRSVPLIFGLAAWLFVVVSRLLVKSYFFYMHSRRHSFENVLIYGAGSAGSQLIHSLKQGFEYRVIGFIDDDHALVGSSLAGVKVYPPAKLEKLIAKYGVNAVLLAIPNATRGQRKSILNNLSRFPVRVQSIPSMSEIISGEQIEKLKEIELDDLLGRDVVVPDAQLMSKCILNNSV